MRSNCVLGEGFKQSCGKATLSLSLSRSVRVGKWHARIIPPCALPRGPASRHVGRAAVVQHSFAVLPYCRTLMGYLRLPHSTECSRMCGMPYELSTGVRNTTPNVLFSSPLITLISSAPGCNTFQGGGFWGRGQNAAWSSRGAGCARDVWQGQEATVMGRKYGRSVARKHGMSRTGNQSSGGEKVTAGISGAQGGSCRHLSPKA